ncbi:MAG: hypothetical protein ACK5PQ_02440 [Alphaproteobacteria bacterium]
MTFYKTAFLVFLLSANLYAASNTPDQDDLPEITTPLALLHLSNTLPDTGAVALAPALQTLSHLTDLNLQSNARVQASEAIQH